MPFKQQAESADGVPEDPWHPGSEGPERRCFMSSVQPQPESVSRAGRLDQILRELLHQTPGVEAAAVVSFDGLPMASALPDGMDEDRVAAMSAALLSLGERAAEGLGRGALSQVYIEGEQGTVFLCYADDVDVLVVVDAYRPQDGL